MRYVNLGKTGLRVSRICLGMMSYGKHESREWALEEHDAEPIVRRAVEGGITFFDTADVYNGGQSEVITGRLLRKLFGMREEYVVATKVHGQTMPGENGRGLSRKHIMASIDASLERLGLDYVDLYQIHRWDPRTPIEETMDALHDVVRAGKARYIGASSMFAWQFAKAQSVAADAVRLDAEPLQPALPRGGARDDPAVHRPGRRRDPVEPARPRHARRQPDARGREADGASQHRRFGDTLYKPEIDFAVVDRAAEVAADARRADRAGRARVAASKARRDRADRGGDQARSPGGRARRRRAALSDEEIAGSRSRTSRTRSRVTPRAPSVAASQAITVDAGGRELRVSNPDREIFPATERSAAVTKLEIVEYYLAVGDGIMRALEGRPTTLERWPKGVHPGIVLSTRERGGGDAFYQKRIPKGAPEYVQTAQIAFPSGRHADEVCPTEIAVVGWAAQMGTITFHPWPVRREDVDHPDELRLDLDPQPGTDFADAVSAAGEARTLLAELGYTGFPKTSGGRGIHIYVRLEPRWTFTDVRHAAIAFGRALERRLPDRVTTSWWKEERGERIFVDYNQNARDRTIASAYSIRAKPGAPVSAPLDWDELAAVAPEDFTVATMPARFKEVGDRHAAINDVAHSLQPLLDLYQADAERGQGDMPYPPDYPKMPGEPKRVQPSRDRDRPR